MNRFKARSEKGVRERVYKTTLEKVYLAKASKEVKQSEENLDRFIDVGTDVGSGRSSKYGCSDQGNLLDGS